MQKILCQIRLCVRFWTRDRICRTAARTPVCAYKKRPPTIGPGDVCKAGIYSMHSTVQACSRVAVAYGWKLPSGMPLKTPARCSACTADSA